MLICIFFPDVRTPFVKFWSTRPNSNMLCAGTFPKDLNPWIMPFWPTRPRSIRWSLFSHMVSVRHKNKKTRYNASVKTKYSLQRAPCVKIMRTCWLWPGGSSKIRQPCLLFIQLFDQMLNCCRYFMKSKLWP